METADGGLLVGEVREHRVEIRHPQDFARAGTQIHGPQFGAIFPRGVEPAYQLADAGAIEVRDVVKIQEHTPASFLEQILQQIVDRFAFNQGKAPSNIHYRNFTQLPGAGTKSQTGLPGTGVQLFYRMRAEMWKC
jgi:hypothetical protein